jgi:hypothetical protein
MTITEHIRKHLFEQILGVPTKGFKNMPSLESLRQTEWNDKFFESCKARMVMGAFRYGLINTPNKPEHDHMQDIKNRAQAYIETGNDELLCDIVNMAMVEFTEGRHPNKHFKSTDDGTIHAEVKK